MTYRVFSKKYTHSSSDYINAKKFNSARCDKNNTVKGSTPYYCYINCNKVDINNCEQINMCNSVPMNLIQGKTSYICNNNNIDYTCKDPLKMYPYGLYMCESDTCNSCGNVDNTGTTKAIKDQSVEPAVVDTQNTGYKVLDLFYPTNV